MLFLRVCVPRLVCLRVQSIHPSNAKTPLLICHGDADMVVNVLAGKKAAEIFEAAGVPTELRLYPGLGHSSHPQEMREAFAFITDKLKL